MTTQRTAQVRIIATASADWTEMVEIPDHVLPDQVDGWVEKWARATKLQWDEWDDTAIDPVAITVTGEWATYHRETL